MTNVQDAEIDYLQSARAQLEDISSWHCEPSGCVTIGDGCACGYCELVIQDGPVYSVYKASKVDVMAEICVVVDNKGLCNNVYLDRNVIGNSVKCEANYQT